MTMIMIYDLSLEVMGGKKNNCFYEFLQVGKLPLMPQCVSISF